MLLEIVLPAVSPWLMLISGAVLFVGGVAVVVMGGKHDAGK